MVSPHLWLRYELLGMFLLEVREPVSDDGGIFTAGARGRARTLTSRAAAARGCYKDELRDVVVGHVL